MHLKVHYATTILKAHSYRCRRHRLRSTSCGGPRLCAQEQADPSRCQARKYIDGAVQPVLLTHFGLVMIAQTSHSQSSEYLAVTVAYIAPEQLRRRPRFASDQYALRIVIYESLCGKRPFIGSFPEWQASIC